MVVGGLQPPPEEEEEALAAAAGQGILFVLENAQLETAQVGKVRGLVCLVGQIVTPDLESKTVHGTSIVLF